MGAGRTRTAPIRLFLSPTDIHEESVKMSRKVLVTGLGATTPIGGDVPTTWANALKGVSGITTIDEPWVEEYDLPVYIAGRVAVPAQESERLSKVEAKRLDPSGQLALIAAREAWEDAGFSGPDAESAKETDPVRTGVAFWHRYRWCVDSAGCVGYPAGERATSCAADDRADAHA